MADTDDRKDRDRMLDALVANTEAMTHLNSSVSSHHAEYAEGRKISREFANNIGAKVDNLDRSVSELRLAGENGEKARQGELKRIFDLLVEERQDRREAITEGKEGERDARVSERDFVRNLIKEEMGERKENKNMLVAAGQEVWKVGGKYVVAAVCLLIVAAVMKLTGISLADIIGLTSGK